MMLKEEVGMLRLVPLFSGIEPAKLKLLAFTSDRVSYRDGQELFKQGDEGDAAYVILSGEADVIVEFRQRADNGCACRTQLDCRRNRDTLRRIPYRNCACQRSRRNLAHSQGSFSADAAGVPRNDHRDRARSGYASF